VVLRGIGPTAGKVGTGFGPGWPAARLDELVGYGRSFGHGVGERGVFEPLFVGYVRVVRPRRVEPARRSGRPVPTGSAAAHQYAVRCQGTYASG